MKRYFPTEKELVELGFDKDIGFHTNVFTLQVNGCEVIYDFDHNVYEIYDVEPPTIDSIKNIIEALKQNTVK